MVRCQTPHPCVGVRLRIYYGGTFDPVHNGHLAIATAAQSAFSADVILLPSADPPHRPPASASAEQRAAMVDLAIAGHPGVPRQVLGHQGRGSAGCRQAPHHGDRAQRGTRAAAAEDLQVQPSQSVLDKLARQKSLTSKLKEKVKQLHTELEEAEKQLDQANTTLAELEEERAQLACSVTNDPDSDVESQKAEPEAAQGETPPTQAQQSEESQGSTWRAKPKARSRPQGLNPDLSGVREDELDILILMARKEKKRELEKAATFEISQEEEDEGDEEM